MGFYSPHINNVLPERKVRKAFNLNDENWEISNFRTDYNIFGADNAFFILYL